MAKGIRVGVGGVKTSKKVWVGVGGVARKVKKIFAGIGGVVKLVFGGEPTKVPNAPTLGEPRNDVAVASIGNYALITGALASGVSNTVDVYDFSLLRTQTPSGLRNSVRESVGASNNSLAFFGGGRDVDREPMMTVTSYDTSLVRGSPSNFVYRVSGHVGVSSDDYALFAGGDSDGYCRNYTYAYDKSGVNVVTSYLFSVAYNLGGAKVGNYALFGGGHNGSKKIDIVTGINLNDRTKVSVTPLSLARTSLKGGANKNYALFIGGNGDSVTYDDVVDAYDESLVHSVPVPLSQPSFGHGVIGTDDYVIVTGGRITGYPRWRNTVETYDTSLVKGSLQALSIARYFHEAVSVGSNILVAGGNTRNEATDTVEVYEY